MRSIPCLLIFLSSLLVPINVHANKIAIVIDDIGNHQRHLDLLSLPGNLTFAILPHTPFSQTFAYLASKQSKELILHIPMQAIESKNLGPGALTLDMDKQTLQMTLGNALASLPQVIGVNNHMGSALTQHSAAMKWTMEILRKRGLFFLDSRTTTESQAQITADLYGVAIIAREVFLDNNTHSTYLLKQLKRAKSLSLRNGYTVLIAHPYPETVAFLDEQIPILLQQGYELISLSQIVNQFNFQLAKNANTIDGHASLKNNN